MHRTLAWWAMPTLLVALAGCGGDAPNAPENAASTEEQLPWSGVKIQLVVADDDELAKAVGRLRGEWRGSTGAELEIRQLSQSELLDANSLAADAVICPAYLLGMLAQRDWLAPLPESVSASDDLASGDVFEANKAHDASWGPTAYGVSFGSPVFVCMYRTDLLKKLDRHPPATWQEYQELAALLADGEKLGVDVQATQGWSGAMEPLAPGWAGLTLLARAASYAKHRNHYSALFDIESMEPLIAGPPFVRALDELAAASRLSPDSLAADPAAVAEAFLQGRCGLALTWLAPRAGRQAADERENKAESAPLDVGFAELPGGSDVYNPKTRLWEKRRGDEPRHVPLLGVSGRVGCVSKSSNHAEAAWQLLVWLSGPKWSERVAGDSRATTIYRGSQRGASEQWVDASIEGPAAHAYAQVVERSLAAVEWLGAPRIAGRQRYLEALDQAVVAAVRGEVTAQAALEKAAAAWREITDELGLERQKVAYRRSLGLR